MKKKIQNIVVFVEFLAGSGLAILFHVVLNYPQAAYIIFGVGMLLSLGTYVLSNDIEKTRDTLLDQYHKAHETTFMIAQIADPECQAKAHEVMAAAKRTLSLLHHGRIPLDENEFYKGRGPPQHGMDHARGASRPLPGQPACNRARGQNHTDICR
jgi:hypothetical protein